MTRGSRILFALLLLAATSFGPVLLQHDDLHAEGAAAERRVDSAAAHAQEADHVEGAGELEPAGCTACLLRLQRAGLLLPPEAAPSGLRPEETGLAPLQRSPLARLTTCSFSRAPPTA